MNKAIPLIIWVLLFAVWAIVTFYDKPTVWEEKVEEIITVGTETGVYIEDELPVLIEECNPVWARVTAKFTQDFIDKYQYEDSRGYRFALNINSWYYNVFRNKNNWVANSVKDWLTGAIPAYRFNEWYTWYVPYNTGVKVAGKKDNFWYVYQTFTGIDTYRLSPTKETSDIADFKIEEECE